MHDYLDIICCPETHQSLRVADAELLTRINSDIAAGSVKNRGGKPVSRALEGGLIRDDKKFLYPIYGGIPAMLIDEAIPL